MDEVEALVRTLLGAGAAARTAERVTLPARRSCASSAWTRSRRRPRNWRAPPPPRGFTGSAATARDELSGGPHGLGHRPALGRGALTFIYRYPASQAALARLDPQDPRAALRFELYGEGIELANGFHELAAAAEQRARFEQDQAERGAGPAVHALDERLLAALEHGLPDCAGVALGFDRRSCSPCGAAHIDEVLAFPTARA